MEGPICALCVPNGLDVKRYTVHFPVSDCRTLFSAGPHFRKASRVCVRNDTILVQDFSNKKRYSLKQFKIEMFSLEDRILVCSKSN